MARLFDVAKAFRILPAVVGMRSNAEVFVTFDGTPLRQLTLDTSRVYQPSGLPRYRVREGSDVPR
jgi:hypothetical protein